jgi:hypothetical protein
LYFSGLDLIRMTKSENTFFTPKRRRRRKKKRKPEENENPCSLAF